MYVGHIIITIEICVFVRILTYIPMKKLDFAEPVTHTKIYILLPDAKILSKIFFIITNPHQVNISNNISMNLDKTFFLFWHGFQIWVM